MPLTQTDKQCIAAQAAFPVERLIFISSILSHLVFWLQPRWKRFNGAFSLSLHGFEKVTTRGRNRVFFGGEGKTVQCKRGILKHKFSLIKIDDMVGLYENKIQDGFIYIFICVHVP